MTTPAPEIFDALRELQTFIGDNARDKGFHENEERVSALAESFRDKGDHAFADHLESLSESQLLMLVSDELSETHEDVRSGMRIHEETVSAAPGKEGKPEGPATEIADAIIRLFDTAYRRKLDVAGVIQRKMAYNATRERLHGRKF